LYDENSDHDELNCVCNCMMKIVIMCFGQNLGMFIVNVKNVEP